MALTHGGVLITWGRADDGALGRIESGWLVRDAEKGPRYAEQMILSPQPVPFEATHPGEKTVDFFCGPHNTFVKRKVQDEDRHVVYAFGMNDYGQLGLGMEVCFSLSGA